MKKVLVTGIGGNVGQGILQNIRNLDYSIYIVGTNIEFLSAGNYLCDKVYKTPYAYEDEYASVIKSICETEKIDLLIPSTDYEVYHLGLLSKEFNIAVSPPNVTKVFLNKYETFKAFYSLNIPFAETILPSKYRNNFNEIIVKPSEGRGSRNIYRNPTNIGQFTDEYIVQKLYYGTEITTAFYVTKKRKLHGLITFSRKLTNGTTTSCEVTFKYDTRLYEIIEDIIKNFEIKGSCNIQCIVTSDNVIVPFEINCRISGTNSIRANFGFNDVKYTIEEYLYNKEPEKEVVTKGSAIRILKDIIYPNTDLKDISDKSTSHYLY